MSKKRVSYQNLLKEAISEFDTSKTVDVKGPMLDPILKWDGQGELPIYKDAASILERYYFDEASDKGVEVAEMEYNEDGTEAKTDAMKDAEGTGTDQAGTSDKATIPADKKEIAKDLAKESEMNNKDVPPKKKYVDEKDEVDVDKDEKEEDEKPSDLTEDLENAVIEKLIAEMEDEEVVDDEVVDEAEVMNYTGDDVKPGMNAKKEKKASGPEEDTSGAGTEQAGTGTAAGQVPDRKDNADKMVKPKNYNEADDVLDADKKKDVDVDDDTKEYEEAFQIFKEAIEDEDEEDTELNVDDGVEVKDDKIKEDAAVPSAVPGGPDPDEDEDEKDKE